MNVEIKQPRQMLRNAYEPEKGDRAVRGAYDLDTVLRVAQERCQRRGVRQEVRRVPRTGEPVWVIQDVR